MAFQEFGQTSERRKADQKQKKKFAIAVVAISVLIILIAAGAFAIVNLDDDDANKSHGKPISTSSKSVQTMCSSTDYKEVCEKRLSKAISNTSNPEPQDIIKAAIMVVIDEVSKAFHKTDKLKSDDPQVNGAIEDCVELFDHAKDELKSTLEHVDGTDLQNLPDKAHDIQNWLSAVVSYQQTCVDGFPEGKLKTKMQKTMTMARQLTSNALAIIHEASSILTMLNIPGFSRRRLLQEGEAVAPPLAADGLPDWIPGDQRRALRAKALKMPKPNVVVAKDGSGNYKTINRALKKMPKNYEGRYVIYIKEGTYKETVMVTKKMVNVSMYGDGSRKTIITGNKNYVDGVRTFKTATFAAIGEGFMAQGIGFRNTAGAAKHQAVALRVQSDRSIFLNCRMEGYQDTLYTQTHRQFYRSCVVAGTIDFIFGDGAVVLQNCILVVRKPLDNQQNIVTAQGRTERHETTGIVIQNCRIIPDRKMIPLKNTIKSYLGRPWKEYSRTIIMESKIGDLIHPDGWLAWDGDFALKTLYYAEYNNKGPGSNTTARVKWPGYKKITMERAMKYTVENFIQGGSWIRATGTPVHLGLFSMRGVI
ncbi:pectinesterase-like [Magnolia sinica]|uniref:pectinesterase-like n=1 Tax=Magnolia sinica TaxID=86752 RepID=UPI00265B073B|nr:pectinesterase-like [Magnolia sinica]